MSYSLGQWAVIDLETTGVNPANDAIIDVGFLQFEEGTLVRSYESLVYTDQKLSQFIQKLTGITPKMVTNAPQWRGAEQEVQTLFGHHLLAHNADFERSFLEGSFDEIDDGSRRESYEDSLFILGILFPERKTLKLEQFIIDWKLADGEQHRGLADSVDLLKVLLVAAIYVKRRKYIKDYLFYLFQKYQFEDCWYFKFLFQDESTLVTIGDAIEFDLLDHYDDSLFKSDCADELDNNSKVDLQFDGEHIKKVLQNEPLIQKVLPYYKFRESQQELSLRVGQSLKNGIHSLIQAPTGTGKTFGYLIPAMIHAHCDEQQILIATGTKTLQEQAFRKDLPVAMKVLGLDREEFKTVKLIGSSNHYCPQFFEQIQKETDMLTLQDEQFKWASIFFEMLYYYNKEVEQDQRLTRDDISFVLKMKNEHLRSLDNNTKVDFRACTGRRCSHKESCSYYQGIQKAKDAQIIIGNHALMYSWTSSFPRPQSIIVDEAHRLEHETTSAFTVELAQEQLIAFTRTLQRQQGLGSLFYLVNQHNAKNADDIINGVQASATNSLQMVADHLPIVIDEIERWFKERVRYTSLYWNESEMLGKSQTKNALETSIYNHLLSLSTIFQDLHDQVVPIWNTYDQGQFDNEADLTAYNRFELFWGHLEDIVAGFQAALEDDDFAARSIAFHEKEGFLLKSAPVDVGKIISEKLLAPSHAVVMTSATLGSADATSSQKGIEWATGYLHVAAEKRFKQGFFLPSVYDYKNRAKVFLCSDVPYMNDSTFVPTILDPVIDLLIRLEGKGLLLFSSKVRFEAAREILLERLSGKLTVYVQGMGNNVIDEFKKDEHAVLLGMESFGEGIDIPGDALQFILIDKVPDIRMDLVIKKRQDFFDRTIGNSFVEYNLSSRTRALHQKLGRLLRTESDSGGIIIVDSRLKKWKGRTLAQFDELMNPYVIERDSLVGACDKVFDFITSDKV